MVSSEAACYKLFQSKVKACPVNTGFNMAFRYHFSFITVLTGNFNCCLLQFMTAIVFKLKKTTISLAVLCHWSLSRNLFLDR